MDSELIAYLDTHFGKTSQQISEVHQQVAALREETLQRFEQVDRRFEEVNARFEQVNARFEQVDARFEQVETTCRQTLVLVEGLRHELQVVAEGYLGINERLQVEIEKTEVQSSRMQGWMEPYFKDLDIRVKSVESRVDRQNMDVFEAVHKILGRPLPKQP